MRQISTDHFEDTATVTIPVSMGQMLFLSPNQLYQSSKGNKALKRTKAKYNLLNVSPGHHSMQDQMGLNQQTASRGHQHRELN